MGIPRYIISNFLKWFKIWYSFYNLSHLDKSRKISEKFNQWFIRTILIEMKLSLKEFKSIANIFISKQIIQRKFKEKEIQKWRILKKILLNNKYIKKYLYKILYFNKII